MPYKGFNRILKIVQKEAHGEEQEFEKRVKEINKKLEDFCKEINLKERK